MMLKTKEETKCSWDIALSWALNAKNSMQMQGGFSAYQLAMGRNPNLPNVIVNRLPALEESTSSKTVAENLNAIHGARAAFAKAGARGKIRKALRSQVRTCNDDYFQNGEKVMFKRKGTMKWSGPGVVLVRDKNQYLVKHGNQFYRCSACHLTRANSRRQSVKTQRRMLCSGEEQVTTGNPACSFKENNYLEHNEILLENPEQPMLQEEDLMEELGVSKNDNEDQQVELNAQDQIIVENPTKSFDLPKPKSHVEFLPKNPEEDGEEWIKVYIHSRGGKTSGKYKNCLNIQLDGDDDIKCVDWLDLAVDWREYVPAVTEEEVFLTSEEIYEESVIEAKEKDLEDVYEDVYEDVDDKVLRIPIACLPQRVMMMRLWCNGFPPRGSWQTA